MEILTGIILAAVALLLTFYGRTLYIALVCLPRDFTFFSRGLRLLIALKWAQYKNMTAGKFLEKNARRVPDKVAFYCGDDSITFAKADELSNRIANYFAAQGYRRGDVVALLMDNRVEYPCIWLGLSKLGVISALINYNLRLGSLLHCIKVANAKAIIYGRGYSSAIQEVLDLGELPNIKLYSFDPEESPAISGAQNLAQELQKVSKESPNPSDGPRTTDPLCYVYTSGTTGLPKAAVIKNHRFLMGALGTHHVQTVTENDVMLTPLPVYHMAGGILFVGTAVTCGVSLVIVKKFSASRFWHECIRRNVTVCQYLGEICRFLLAATPKPEEKQHQVRMFIGAGLRAEIWKEFVSRFNISLVSEMYGATEGNCHMVNFEGHTGAVGFFPAFTKLFMHVAIIRVDKATGEPIRDPQTGLCAECPPGEQGELVAVIKSNPMHEFPGYTDAESSNKKILHNVFSKGDRCFRAGDMMVKDDYGYFYFRDRTGDTFRWKGENVSTLEVETAVASFCGRKDVAVYGVTIPRMDGRAGMAAIADPDNEVDLDQIAAGLQQTLPSYSRPLFIRIIPKMELTGTFKLQKVQLQKEELNLDIIKDPLYFYSGDKYVPLDRDLHQKIMSGQMRV